MLVYALLATLIISIQAQGTPSIAVVIGDDLIARVGTNLSATIEQKVAATHPPPYVVNNSTFSTSVLTHPFHRRSHCYLV